ncbi:hypothetical protein EMIT0P74_230045 [Pseudomonas sp. IT-P74]
MNAQMVKLVDTPASGAGDRKVVEVRVFFWAPIQIQGYDLEFHRNPRKRVFAFLAPEKSPTLCRSELARDALENSACSQTERAIVHAHREQARSYRNQRPHLRNNIVYHCCKFLQCDSEEPCE